MSESFSHFEQFRIRDEPQGSECDLNYFRGEGASNYPSSGEYLNPESSYKNRFTDLSDWVASFMNRGTLADVGGSVGHMHYWMQRLHPTIQIVCADYGIEALKYGKKNDESLRAIHASGDRMPFAANALDGVLFADVLEHIQPDLADRALSEATRTLKPDGHLFVTIPNRNTWTDKNWHDPTHLWIPNKNGMTTALEDHGFHDVSVHV
ncbi:class I SAM-dependent methyltransferase [Candidatus Microgenomates bacterium]|nr:class I SAM-dependent methyltransferase [Candidatus Microgenomates bacterium]